MTLLAFVNSENSPVKNLLEVDHRHVTATIVNTAILDSYHEESMPEITRILKLLNWGQKQLSQKIKYPVIEKLHEGRIKNIEDES